MSKLILGIVGEIGSGKGIIAKHIELEHKGGVHKFSAILRDVLNRIHIEQTRDNMSVLSTILRKNFGDDLLAKTMFHDTQDDQHDIVIVDGVRRMTDITFLKELPNFKLIYVEANMETRYGRLIKRRENPDDAEKTFEEFQKEHELETELQIQDLRNYADYIVNNDGTFPELYKQLEDIIKQNI